MFQELEAAAPDEIIALIGLYREDERPHKIDLGVGVYKDARGGTPVMAAVRTAERRLIESQRSKTYVGLEGDRAFNAELTQLVLGAGLDPARTRTMQAPGGSGAVRILAELLAGARPGASIWLSDPTWANHEPTFRAAGLAIRTYPYFDPLTCGLRFEAMLEALRAAPAQDVVLLHGCCHNPTGASLDLAQWRALGEVLLERDLFPFVDLAYQGFGEGLDEDAAGVRHLLDVVPEMVVAVSCSKNFAVYCDRVGAAILVGRTAGDADLAFGHLKAVARRNYSMPPNHGAAAVRLVLEDPDLRATWRAELEAMRERMQALRAGLAQALRRQTNGDRFDYLTVHRGMFSRLGLSRDQVEQLRREYAIYMVGDSRVNVAGLPDDRLEDVARAIVAVSS